MIALSKHRRAAFILGINTNCKQNRSQSLSGFRIPCCSIIICKHLDVSTCYRCVHVPLDSSVMHTLTSVTSSMNVHPWSERIHGQNVPSRVHRIDVWLLRNKPPWVTNFHLMSLWWRMFAYTPIHRLMMVPVVSNPSFSLHIIFCANK